MKLRLHTLNGVRQPVGLRELLWLRNIDWVSIFIDLQCTWNYRGNLCWKELSVRLPSAANHISAPHRLIALHLLLLDVRL